MWTFQLSTLKLIPAANCPLYTGYQGRRQQSLPCFTTTFSATEYKADTQCKTATYASADWSTQCYLHITAASTGVQYSDRMLAQKNYLEVCMPLKYWSKKFKKEGSLGKFNCVHLLVYTGQISFAITWLQNQVSILQSGTVTPKEYKKIDGKVKFFNTKFQVLKGILKFIIYKDDLKIRSTYSNNVFSSRHKWRKVIWTSYAKICPKFGFKFGKIFHKHQALPPHKQHPEELHTDTKVSLAMWMYKIYF